MNLLYFTNSYPYGLGEQWKANELNVLINHFDKITVVPFSYGGNFDHPKNLPLGVEMAGPLFKDHNLQVKKIDLFRLLFSRHVGSFFVELISSKAFLNKVHFISWLGSSLNVLRLLESKLLQHLIKEADSNCVLYFYWGKGSNEVLPFINTARFHKVFVRMHRYDLFEYLNNNYIPYRKALLNVIDVAAPSSVAGKIHLQQLYPNAKAEIMSLGCGTIGNGKVSPPSHNNVFRIISCSLLSPVKRIHLMIECLPFLKMPVLWRHVGGGVLMEELKAQVERLGMSDKFIFEGMMNSDSILDFYTDNEFDIFINTSSSEGVPFSIMEAFSAGIPVMATDVGGTREIVDEKTGALLSAEIRPEELARELTTFYHLSIDLKLKIRKASIIKYENICNASTLTQELASILKK